MFPESASSTSGSHQLGFSWSMVRMATLELSEVLARCRQASMQLPVGKQATTGSVSSMFGSLAITMRRLSASVLCSSS